MTENKCTLIVFVKNPRPGKVKTRLAESVGDKKALRIYHRLLEYTKSVVRPLAIAGDAEIQVWFSSHIPENGFWKELDIQQKVQQPGDLGERMNHASETVFDEGYEKAVIIGSDCAELTASRIREAFRTLDRVDVVIGPSDDGGYYLIGLNSVQPRLFEAMPWSEPDLLRQTIDRIKEEGLSCTLLERLNDVDTLEDWESVKDRLPV